MSYIPHQWEDGEIINTAKLNRIEEGIAEAAQTGGSDDLLIVHFTESSNTLTADITAGDIYTHIMSGGVYMGVFSYVPSFIVL